MLTLTFAGYQSAASVHTSGLHAFAAAVARRSAGALAIAVEDNVTTRGLKAGTLPAMVASGVLDGCYIASSYLAGAVASLRVLDLPFQAQDRTDMFAALDGDAGRTLAAAVAHETPHCMLGTWDNGIRHISNGVRPIRTPADCEGIVLRTLDNALHQEAFRALGFRPVFIDVAELPEAVATGRVMAQENPLTNLVNFGLHVHHPQVSLTGHLLGVVLVLMNGRRRAALPAELRDVLDAGMREAEQVQRRLAAAEDAQCMARLAEAGVHPIGPEAIDLAAFRSVLAPLVERERAAIDRVLLEQLLQGRPGALPLDPTKGNAFGNRHGLRR